MKAVLNAEFVQLALRAMPAAQLPEHVEPGKVVRFNASGRVGDASGWLCQFRGGRAGAFGCTGSLRVQTWISSSWNGLTRLDRAEVARQVAQAVVDKRVHHGRCRP